MTLIAWGDEYSVNIKEIDEQHKILFNHLNNLFSAMEKNEDKKMISSLLTELLAYVDYHFGTEEKYFKKFNYEKTDTHIGLHAIYVNQIKDFQNKFNDEKPFVSFEILNFLEDWILQHISIIDKEYTKCFNDHGVV